MCVKMPRRRHFDTNKFQVFRWFIFSCTWATDITIPFQKGGDIPMGNDTLNLLFEAGLFLIALLTLIVLLIEKISKK